MSGETTTTTTTTTSENFQQKEDKLAEAEECMRLRAFKDFLREQQREAEINRHAELRSCMTRNNNDTYAVSPQELKAEVTMTLWAQLQKRCPPHFRLPLCHAIAADVEKECLNAKECDFTCILASGAKAENACKEELYFDLVKLQKFVINSLEKFLTRLTDNAEMANLKNYAEPGSLCISGKCTCNSRATLTPTYYVVGNIKNKPRKMEDRHACLERFSELYTLHERPAFSFYGVFDGHSGSLAASYAACHLPQLLAERLREAPLPGDDTSTHYREAFEAAFLQTDKMFTQKCISSGTTAVCVLLATTRTDDSSELPPHLAAAWVGDSKALLVSPTVSLQLVKPHKPDAPDERKRIESFPTGGAVVYVQDQWRVNGILNVSRSIGDYKVNAVIAEPDFVDVQLTTAHDFLVLGTDGLFDHVSDSEIVKTIYEALADAAYNIEDIPKALIELAKQGDSQDNITAVVVFLKQRVKIAENYKRKA